MKKLKYIDVKNYIESFNYKLLSKEYIGSFDKLDIKCDNGHLYQSSFANFKNYGRRCPKCNGKEKFLYDDVKSYIESKGYKLLSTEYKNICTKLKIQCNHNHLAYL
jgi:hypothetical protein